MFELIGNLIKLIAKWYVWMPIVTVLLYLTYRNYLKLEGDDDSYSEERVLLLLEIPKTNDKSELAAEQLFASLHGILKDPSLIKKGEYQDHLSFEIASFHGQIVFFVSIPKDLQNFVEGQIYAQYPTVQIKVVSEDYTRNDQAMVVQTAEIDLRDNQFLPIKTFNGFEVDPLAGITGTLAKAGESGEQIWIQVLARPIADSWHKKADRWVKTNIVEKTAFRFDLRWFLQILVALWTPPEVSDKKEDTEKKLSEREKIKIAGVEQKSAKLGYQVKIRVAYLGENQQQARLKTQAILGTFKQFDSTNLNGFKLINKSDDPEKLRSFRNRSFNTDGYILNIEELASLYHLPHTNVETPNIVWANSKTAEPPAKLPLVDPNNPNDIGKSVFGLTNFRGVRHQFGILRRDRSRHLYIIGQTGAGKSGTLELLALSDIYHNQGYAIIDPHGDFAIDNLRFVPENRIEDVIYFNPADTEFPLGFNPLEITDPNQRLTISSEVIGVLKRMFGYSWGPRLEHILRFTILAMLERPSTTMLDITRMLTDKNFRKETLHYVTDTVVLQFWKQEFASWNEKYATEAIAPILNKVGAFTANPIIRNIIGQPKSTFDIRQIMDEGKILVVNLSKGLIGEDNAAILGAFLVTKIQLAAMSRSDIPNIADRRPFYLYVDEFQNFATDSFATILSEARKYGLNLTVANQYIAQMSDEVRTAVFGNVGSMISFRVSADDAAILAKQFEPQFSASDLVNMNNRNFVMNMIINGEKQSAFSASTLDIPEAKTDYLDQIIVSSRKKFSRLRSNIEQEISQAIKIPEQFDTPSRQRFLSGDKKAPKKENKHQLKKELKKNAPASKPKNDDYKKLDSDALQELKSMFDNFKQQDATKTAAKTKKTDSDPEHHIKAESKDLKIKKSKKKRSTKAKKIVATDKPKNIKSKKSKPKKGKIDNQEIVLRKSSKKAIESIDKILNQK